MSFITSQIFIPSQNRNLLPEIEKAIDGLAIINSKKRKILLRIDKSIENPDPDESKKEFSEKWEAILVYQQKDCLKIILNEVLVNSLQYYPHGVFKLFKKIGIQSKFTKNTATLRPDIRLSLILSQRLPLQIIHLTTLDSGSTVQYEVFLHVSGEIADYKYYLTGDAEQQTNNLHDFSVWKTAFPDIHGWNSLQESVSTEDQFLQRNPPKSRILDLFGVTGVDEDAENPLALIRVCLFDAETGESIVSIKKHQWPEWVYRLFHLGIIVIIVVWFVYMLFSGNPGY